MKNVMYAVVILATSFAFGATTEENQTKTETLDSSENQELLFRTHCESVGDFVFHFLVEYVGVDIGSFEAYLIAADAQAACEDKEEEEETQDPGQ